jgi:sarcosine oxidase subunit alpha
MGHYLLGYDSDGLTTPRELGIAADEKRSDFVGARSLKIIAQKPLQKQLAAFVLASVPQEMPKDCNLVIEHQNIIGRVTSVAMSPSLGKVIGFAYLPPSHMSVGTSFEIRCDSGRMLAARVTDRHFLS